MIQREEIELSRATQIVNDFLLGNSKDGDPSQIRSFKFDYEDNPNEVYGGETWRMFEIKSNLEGYRAIIKDDTKMMSEDELKRLGEPAISRLYLLTPEEWGNYIVPFRGISVEELMFMILARTNPFKPIVPVSAEKAMTREGVRTIYYHLGIYDSDLSGVCSEDEETALEYDPDFEPTNDCERQLSCEACKKSGKCVDKCPLHYVLTDFNPAPVVEALSGVKIKNARSYAQAISKMIKDESGLTIHENDMKKYEEGFQDTQTRLFLMWTLYEFMRVETWDHLKDCLTQFKKFLLPKDWEKSEIAQNVMKCSRKSRNMDFDEVKKEFEGKKYPEDQTKVEKKDPEVWILSHYLGGSLLDSLNKKVKSAREISSVTGVPLDKVLSAMKMKEKIYPIDL